MASLQNPAPGSKSAKFVAADPLAPMVDPFQHLDDDQRDVQQVLAENVNNRLTKAMEELKVKHAKGTNEVDDPDRAPTGTPYRQIQEQQAQAAQQRQQQQKIIAQEEEARKQLETENLENLRCKVQQQVEDGVDSDDEFDELLEDDNDPVLEAIRQKRLMEMKRTQSKHAEHIALGHGQYRTISQDEFLPECTGQSEYVAIHFFHKEFERCKIMDQHLQSIALRHTTCKFLRIDAEKAPFFVQKLAVRTLPTLIVFHEGKAVNRLTGFEGLATSAAEPDKFQTCRLQTWLAETGAIEYDMAKDEFAREELLAQLMPIRGAIWSSVKEYGEDF